jgi:DNA-binding MarR family transcriptional regulator
MSSDFLQQRQHAPGHGDAPVDRRQALLSALEYEVRAGQRSTDIHDDLICGLLGINRSDSRCLDILEQQGRMTAGQLATESRLTTGAITAVIDRLERAGYAHRVPDPSDRRRVLIQLTPKAYEAAAELMGPMAEAAEDLADRYSDDELQLILDFQRMGRAMQERHADWLRERLKARGRKVE